MNKERIALGLTMLIAGLLLTSAVASPQAIATNLRFSRGYIYFLFLGLGLTLLVSGSILFLTAFTKEIIAGAFLTIVGVILFLGSIDYRIGIIGVLMAALGIYILYKSWRETGKNESIQQLERDFS